MVIFSPVLILHVTAFVSAGVLTNDVALSQFEESIESMDLTPDQWEQLAEAVEDDPDLLEIVVRCGGKGKGKKGKKGKGRGWGR